MPGGFPLHRCCAACGLTAGMAAVRPWPVVVAGPSAGTTLPYLQETAFLTNNDTVVLLYLGDTLLNQDRRRDKIATRRRALKKDPGIRDLAAGMNAAPAQATDAYLRSAPTR